MKKEEINYAMLIIRSAIWAMYGRQKLRMVGYQEVEIGRFIGGIMSEVSGWFDIQGNYLYKLKIEKDTVTNLEIGKLNV